MGYLREMRENQQSEPAHIYTYEPPFPEILDPPLPYPYADNNGPRSALNALDKIKDEHFSCDKVNHINI